MKLIKVTTLAIVAVSGILKAENWVEISRSTKVTISIDPSTIKVISPAIRSAWFQMALKVPVQGISLYKELDRIDCESESTATVSMVSYDSNGENVASDTTAIVMLQYIPAAPGTVAARMVKIACHKVDPSPSTAP